jgi:predicted nucleic acid-binding protein
LGVTALSAFLRRHRRIGLDTSVFIYHLEANAAYAHLAGEVFTWLEGPPHAAVTSTITMTELLVHPYRLGNEPLVNQYFSLLSLFPNLEWVPPDLAIADTAAQLRAQHRLRTPDALQLATAVRRRATGFLTNDGELTRVTAVEVVTLQELL